MGSQTKILFGLIFLLIVGGIGLRLLLSGAEPDSDIVIPAGRPGGVVDAGSSPTPVERPERRALAESGSPLATTVLWPLEVKLDLVSSEEFPRLPDGRRVGSGRDAAFAGKIVDEKGSGVPGVQVRFVAGPNRGRVLFTDAAGDYGANDLYPGLHIVEVRGAGLLGSRREVSLRSGYEEKLSIGYRDSPSIAGTVIDAKGEPIEGATVSIDGQSAKTDSDGVFYVPKVGPGRQVLVEVSHPDYAAFRTQIGVTHRHPIGVGKFTWRLDPKTALEILVPEDVGGPGPALVTILPADYKQPRRFPWHTVNPVEVFPGRPVRVDGLPPGSVEVRVFRHGARAEPAVRQINLNVGQQNAVRISLAPGGRLSGRVLRAGRPAPDVEVRLSAPNLVGATLAYHRKPSMYLESAAMDFPPPAHQETVTTADGRFLFSSYPELAPQRFLEAVAKDGWRATAFVGPEDEAIDLELRAPETGQGELVLRAPGRHQALPIRVVLNGAPQDERLLPPDRELRLTDLAPGTWKLSAHWQNLSVLEEPELRVEGRRELSLDLPAQAIDGQNEEAWLRAGRDFPQ